MATPVGFPVSIRNGNLYLNGLGLTKNATATLINVMAGAARDSTNQVDIILPASIIINGATNGVNGLDTGALANNTFYYVYIIGSSLAANPETNIDVQVSTIGGTALNGIVLTETTVVNPTWTVNNNMQPVGLISLSATAPALPLGYDVFRRIGAVLTGGAATFLPFWQDGAIDGVSRKMWYETPIVVLAAAAAAAMTAQALNAAVPAAALNGAQTEVQFQADLLPNAAAAFVQMRPTGSAAANGSVKMSGSVAAVHKFDQLQCIAALNAANPQQASIDWMTDAVSTVALTVSAYTDNL